MLGCVWYSFDKRGTLRGGKEIGAGQNHSAKTRIICSSAKGPCGAGQKGKGELIRGGV